MLGFAENKCLLVEYCLGRIQLSKIPILDHLMKNEMPGKIYLCDEAWTAENGLLTEALKLKRRPIKEKYEQVIANLYKH